MERRRLLTQGMATIATIGCAPIIRHEAAIAQAMDTPLFLEHHALNRMGFGPRPGDVKRIQAMGFAAYVEEQLNPSDRDSPDVQQRLQTAKLPLNLWADDEPFLAAAGKRLSLLDKSIPELWQSFDEEDEESGEWLRPLLEVNMATWIRAVYSPWQLQEVLVDFWHNHFNVNAYGDDPRIAVTWPAYDRLMRQHCLGNFRTFLEAVAQSPPMLFYLDNATSRASPANENYARELFELHTLGAEHYVNDRYPQWQDVPTDAAGVPMGFIDEDVYEAARAFTGWTVATGEEVGEAAFLPNTGEFHYHEGWHDPYQKRVLGVALPSHQPALADGYAVLDLVAYHPATARHLCTKLCRRLVADDPSPALVEKAIATWMATQKEPNQIQQTVRTILLSPEFQQAQRQKVKRPFAMVVSYLRATNADLTPTLDLLWMMEDSGHLLFGWPTPDGHPETSTHWLGTQSLLSSWHTLTVLMEEDFPLVSINPINELPESVQTPRQMVTYWSDRLLGASLPAASLEALMSFLAPEHSVDEPWQMHHRDLTDRLNQLLPLIAMTPEFRWR
ncbi:MAG: DUF1800 domain-containing protein [Cyanobacteria bacterium J06638_28]